MVISSFLNFIFKGTALPDVEQLLDALKTKKVDSILVDMYTPVKRKDLLNGSWFEVAKVLKADISHGVVLQGSAVTIADVLSKTVLVDNVQTQFLLKDDEEKEEKEKVSQGHES